MVNTEMRFIIFFAAEDGEALYGQQKEDWELTVAQIMNSLLTRRGLTPRGSLECNPEIPAFPGEEY